MDAGWLAVAVTRLPTNQNGSFSILPLALLLPFGRRLLCVSASTAADTVRWNLRDQRLIATYT